MGNAEKSGREHMLQAEKPVISWRWRENTGVSAYRSSLALNSRDPEEGRPRKERLTSRDFPSRVIKLMILYLAKANQEK